MRRWIGAIVVATGVFLSAGPASGEARASTFVGRVQDSNAYIAVLKDGAKIGGYVCDDGSGSRWIEYSFLRAGRAPLRSGTTCERLGSVRIAGRSATGTIEVGGRKLRFSARRIRERPAGVHFAIGKQSNRLLVAGWILHPTALREARFRGVDTATLRPLETTRAPRLAPNASTIGIGGDTNLPPVQAEPQQLVVINIIAILIALLVPAVQK